jgi:hypothetical protein
VNSKMWHIINKDSLPGEGKGRSRLVSLEMWHVTNEDSLPRGKKEEGMGW